MFDSIIPSFQVAKRRPTKCEEKTLEMIYYNAGNLRRVVFDRVLRIRHVDEF